MTTSIIPPRGVVADMAALSDLDQMIEAIAAAWDGSMTPPDLRAQCLAICSEHADIVKYLRAVLTITLGAWIIDAESERGLDRHALEQVAAVECHQAIAMIMRAAKERCGDAFVPARMAIVAYQIADNVAKAEPFKCDIDGAVATWRAAKEGTAE